MTMATSQSLALEPSTQAPTPQCSLRKKQSIPPVSLFSSSPTALCAHLVCDKVFLSQACDPISSLQTLQTPVVHNCITPSGGIWGSYHGSGVLGAPSCEPAPGSLIAASFPALMPEKSAALRHPQVFM